MIALLLLLAPSLANAEVPLAEMDRLRQMSVAVRVALDAPDSPIVRACHLAPEALSSIGARLALHEDDAAAAWKSLSITRADVEVLRRKIPNCADRGSCELYQRFLRTASPDKEAAAEISRMSGELESRLRNLPSSTFVKAWKSVRNPCSVLKKLTRESRTE